ncbi:MAG: PKD domain-containing protein [Bacteroidota bacterium]
MKKINYLIMSMMVVSVMVLSLSSCEDEPAPEPTVQILQATVDGYAVAFTIAAENATSYAWDFGDGSGTSTDENPLYTYAQSGTYTATVTVTGEGGTASATKDVTLAASTYEMLTGGPAMTNGKSWVMSSTEAVVIFEAEYADLSDPAAIDDELPGGILGMLGLASEYEDLATFLDDGSFEQNVVNDSVTASALYAALNGIASKPSGDDAIVLMPYTPGSGLSFTYNETDLTMSVMPDANAPATVEDITYTGYPYIEIVGEGFLGIIEVPRKYIVFELSTDKLVIGMFAHFPQDLTPGVDYANFEPTHILKLGFIPAP